MMEQSLFYLGLIVLLLSTSFRLIMLIGPVMSMLKIFGTDFFKSLKEFSKLQIPGFKEFISREIITSFLGYLSLLFVLYIFNLNEINLEDLSLTKIIFLYISCCLWVLVDFMRSISMRKKLLAICQQTNKLKSITGKGIDAIRFAVLWQFRTGHILNHYSRKAILGVIKRRSKIKDEEAGKESLVTTTINVLENIISIPERMTKKLSDNVKNEFDVVLRQKFKKYTDVPKSRVLLSIIFSFIPAILLGLFSL